MAIRTTQVIRPFPVAAGVGQLSNSYVVPDGHILKVTAAGIYVTASGTRLELQARVGTPSTWHTVYALNNGTQFSVHAAPPGLVLVAGDALRFNNQGATGTYVVWCSGLLFEVS